MSQQPTSDQTQMELAAATELWEPLAAFAWDQFVTFGTGVVLVERDDLLAARDAMREHGKPGRTFAPGFVPLTDIPPGDDFRALLRTLNPRRQVALLVRSDDASGEEDERLYILEMVEGKRPSPEDCYFTRQRQV